MLDTSGLTCPEPVMLLHNQIRDAEPGDVIKVLATDPATTRDIPQFCRFLGHELIAKQDNNDSYSYLIRKSKTG